MVVFGHSMLNGSGPLPCSQTGAWRSVFYWEKRVLKAFADVRFVKPDFALQRPDLREPQSVSGHESGGKCDEEYNDFHFHEETCRGRFS